MVVVLLEPGTDHTHGTQSLGTVSGSVSSVADASLDGTRAAQINATSTGPHTFLIGGLGSTPGRISFYVKFTQAPSGTAISRALCTNLPGDIVVDRATGLVRLNNATSGSGFVPTVDQWYRFCLARRPNASNWDCQWFVNGVAQQERVNFSSGVASSIRFGYADAVDGMGIYRIKHLYIDTDQSYTDPGDIRVTTKRPAGTTGTTNAWDTIGSGTNRWDRVAESPIELANGFGKNGSGGGRDFTAPSGNAGEKSETTQEVLSYPKDFSDGFSVAVAAGSGTLTCTLPED